jgi:hypothetical protein
MPAPQAISRFGESISIPTVVLARICQHLQFENAQRTLRDVMLTSRESYEINAPLLYRDVYLESGSVESVLRGLMLMADEGVPVPDSRFPWHRRDFNYFRFRKEVEAAAERENQDRGAGQDTADGSNPQEERKRDFGRKERRAERDRLEAYLQSIGTTEVSSRLLTRSASRGVIHDPRSLHWPYLGFYQPVFTLTRSHTLESWLSFTGQLA